MNREASYVEPVSFTEAAAEDLAAGSSRVSLSARLGGVAAWCETTEMTGI